MKMSKKGYLLEAMTNKSRPPTRKTNVKDDIIRQTLRFDNKEHNPQWLDRSIKLHWKFASCT